MKVHLIGVRNFDNIETRTGDTIDGIKLYISFPDDNVYGELTSEKYVSRNVFSNFGIGLDELIGNIGESIDCEFSPNQKIVGIKIGGKK